MTTITLPRAVVEQALALIASARLCEVNSMSSRQEMLRLLIEATDILRAALAQQAEPVEPVGWNWMLDGRPYGQAYYGNPPDADIAERAAIAGRTVRLLYTAPPQQAEPVEPVAHRVVAGALFDFMGWLTSRRKRLVLSSIDDAAPAADAIKDFAEMRGLSLDDAKVQDWNAALAQQAEPVEPPKPAPLKRGITGRCTRKVCECEKEGLGPECIHLEPVIDGYPLWSGIPKAEPVEPVSNEALRLAGLALIGLAEHDQHCDVFDVDDQGRHKACTCGLNDAIAVVTQAGKSAPPRQAEPVEPVAWVYTGIKQDGTEHGPHLVWKPEYMDAMSASKGAKATPLYTAPPQRKPLTEEEIDRIRADCVFTPHEYRDRAYGWALHFARAVERAHGITDPQVADRLARHGIPMSDQDQPEPEDNNPSFG